MGAWGSGPFDSDEAMDWLDGARDADLGAAIAEAFEAALVGTYLDLDVGATAVAAAAFVEASVTADASRIPEDARALSAQWKSNEVIQRSAARALDAVLGPNSELASLWDEAGVPNEWRTRIEALRSRVGSP